MGSKAANLIICGQQSSKKKKKKKPKSSTSETVGSSKIKPQIKRERTGDQEGLKREDWLKAGGVEADWLKA